MYFVEDCALRYVHLYLAQGTIFYSPTIKRKFVCCLWMAISIPYLGSLEVWGPERADSAAERRSHHISYSPA